MTVNIGEIEPFSSVEYSGKTASVVYFAGCNFRCPWCWTYEYIDPVDGIEKELEEVVEEIEQSTSEAVVIDGGEPTRQPKQLNSLCEVLDDMGYPIQVNTNGSNPHVIEELGLSGKIDRLGLDIKAPLQFSRRYSKVIGVSMKEEFKKGIKTILRSNKACKFRLEPRTTIVPNLTDSGHWIRKIAEQVSKYTDTYVLQAFSPEQGTFDREYEEEEKVTRDQLLELAREAQRYIRNVKIKTQETGLEPLS